MNIDIDIKNIIKLFLPPIALQVFRGTKGNRRTKENYGFFGDYSSWSEALSDSSGYDSDIILEKVKTTLLKVKRGEAVYERDSVLFDEIQYSWPVLAGVLRVASENNNGLSVLDFGGSLGSSYFQNREMLSGLDSLKWSIVEQPHCVACGKKYFQSNELVFYDDLNTCILQEQPDVLLASGVLQYLEKPYVILSQIIESGLKWIIIDRTPFIQSSNIVPKLAPDLLTVQIVPSSIYEASYPAWFFHEDNFLKHFYGQYKIIADFNSFESWELEDVKAQNKGYIFQGISK